MSRVVVVAVVAAAAAWPVVAGYRTHRYQPQEEVPLYVNRIGPFANPSLTYEYYQLPFCAPDNIQHKHESLGEVLEGDIMMSSLYDLRFKVDIIWRPLCKVHVTQTEAKEFQRAIADNFYFEFIYDDLPMWGFIGTTEFEVDASGNELTHYYLYTHLHFDVSYNGNRVIHANVTTDPRHIKEVTGENNVIEFSYSANWVETSIPFNKRREVYASYSFFPRELEIHWFSILNSAVLVVLLTGFVAFILRRTIHSDYKRYAKTDVELDEQDDYGWKLVHGDVFRMPTERTRFAAFIGVGAQMVALCCCILALALTGVFYPFNRGHMYTAGVVFYALTSGIAGYVSATFYKQLGGTDWVRNILVTTLVFAGPFLIVAAYLNTVAWVYESTQARPFGTILVVMLIWLLIGVPLTVIGGIMGRRLAQPFDAPCRTKYIQREIPPSPWYRQAWFQIATAGFLPFSAIYIELYYIFASVWGHKPYTLYGVLCVVFLILLIVTACITVALTYFTLAMEDYRWWWRSFFIGGSTAFYVFGYSVYFFYFRSDMAGFYQASYFFSYMLAVSYVFFLMLGAVGFYSSLAFVKRIYRALKTD